MSTLTKGTIDFGFINGRAEEGKHDHEAIGESEYSPCHPSGGMKLVEQQTKRLYGNHLCGRWVPACGNTWTKITYKRPDGDQALGLGRKKHTHHIAALTSARCFRTAVHVVQRSGTVVNIAKLRDRTLPCTELAMVNAAQLNPPRIHDGCKSYRRVYQAQPRLWSKKTLALNEIGDQETNEVCGDIGSEEVVLVLRSPVGPGGNLW